MAKDKAIVSDADHCKDFHKRYLDLCREMGLQLAAKPVLREDGRGGWYITVAILTVPYRE